MADTTWQMVKRILLGKPIPTSQEHHQRLLLRDAHGVERPPHEHQGNHEQGDPHGVDEAAAAPLHASTVVGDTVGDPFKDTTSVALNPIIKFSTLFGLLAVEIAVGIKEAAKAGHGTDYTPYVGIVMLAIALVFVWRSFYAMRIPREERVIPDTETASTPEAGEHHVQVGRH